MFCTFWHSRTKTSYLQKSIYRLTLFFIFLFFYIVAHFYFFFFLRKQIGSIWFPAKLAENVWERAHHKPDSRKESVLVFPNHMPKELMMANHSSKGEPNRVPCLCSQSLLRSTLTLSQYIWYKLWCPNWKRNLFCQIMSTVLPLWVGFRTSIRRCWNDQLQLVCTPPCLFNGNYLTPFRDLYHEHSLVVHLMV